MEELQEAFTGQLFEYQGVDRFFPSITTGLELGVCQAETEILIPFYPAHFVLKKTSRPRKKLVNKKENELSEIVKLTQVLDCTVFARAN